MIRLECIDASRWEGEADVVLTNPYAPVPRCLHGKPTIVSLYEAKGCRRELCEGWLGGARLTEIGRWSTALANTVYVANLPARKAAIEDLVEDELEPGRGWFPLELPRRLLALYADLIPDGAVVWDGFMGRGTVGRACAERGLGYVGLDIDPARVEIARGYLAHLLS